MLTCASQGTHTFNQPHQVQPLLYILEDITVYSSLLHSHGAARRYDKPVGKCVTWGTSHIVQVYEILLHKQIEYVGMQDMLFCCSYGEAEKDNGTLLNLSI